jgi:formylglycine-generating enzyme required for sulfatase activity
MSDREVTAAQFRAFLADRDYPAQTKPADWPGPVPEVTPREDCPVNNVALLDMVLFCNWLSVREGRRPCYSDSGGGVWMCDWDAGGYRLPTEAEWDHAHQAEARTIYFFGEDAEWLPQYAHISATRTVPAGSKLPNRWGLFDMLGNVWEPCWSYQAAPSRPALPDPDPARPLDARVWIVRGGSYDSGTYHCQPGHQSPIHGPGGSMGFRVVCGPAAEGTPAGRDARGRVAAPTPGAEKRP